MTYYSPLCSSENLSKKISPMHRRFSLTSLMTFNQGRGVGVGVSHLKETPIPGPICLIWTFV